MKYAISYRRGMTCALLLATVLSFLAAAVSPARALEGEEGETEVRGYVSVYTRSSAFVYNDEMLMIDSCKLSGDLARASVVLASEAYQQSSVNQTLKDMGYQARSDYGSYERVANLTVRDNDIVAYTIAKKRYGDYMLYCVPIKGTSRNAEWFSNFNLGDPDDNDGYHQGFYAAAKAVLRSLKWEFDYDGIDDDKRIVWLTGHSRGAAVANLVAGKMQDDAYPVSAEHLFCYTFACPYVGKDLNHYDNIFNYNNPGDLITMLPRYEWDYRRYGRDIGMSFYSLENFNARFREVKGANYQGEYSDDSWNNILDVICEDQKDYGDAHMYFDIVAYFLGGCEDVDPFDFADYLIATYPEKALKFVLKKIGKKVDILDRLNTAYYLTRNAIAMLEDLIECAKDEDDWSDAAIQRKIANINSFGIEELLTVSDQDSAIEALEKYKLVSASLGMGVSAIAIFLDRDGSVKPAVDHGHDWRTYEIWINDIYCGYRACANMSFDSTRRTNETFMDKITAIGPNAFFNCSRLTEFDVPDNILAIGDNCFNGCHALEELVIPNHIASLGESAFVSSGLSSLTMPAELAGPKIFNCPNLREIHYTVAETGVMPERTNNGGDKNFYSNFVERNARNSLETAIFDPGVKNIPSHMFFKDSSDDRAVLTSVVLPDSVAEIGEWAFANNEALAFDKLPDGLTTLGGWAFYGTKLRSFILPAGVEEIPKYCFGGCSGIRRVLFPSALQSIGSGAFANSGLTRALFWGELPDMDRPFDGVCADMYYLSSRESWEAANLSGCGGTLAWRAADGPLDDVIALPKGLKTVESGALQGVDAQEIVVPEGTSRLESLAFADCPRLIRIALPSTLRKIAPDAFDEDVLLVLPGDSAAEDYAIRHALLYWRG